MADSGEVLGVEQLHALSKALKGAGHMELRKRLHTSVKPPVRKLIPLTRAEARRVLPKGGGLAERTAKAPQRVKVATGRDPGVSLVVAGNRSAARATNRGTFRHPVFARGGDRKQWAWVSQQVRTSQWFDRPASRALPEVKDAVLQALEDMAREIVEEIGRAHGG